MSNEEYKYLISNLKYFRYIKGYSQEKLAEISDLSASYIKQIEAGRTFKNVSFTTLVKLSKALDVEMFELVKENTKISV